MAATPKFRLTKSGAVHEEGVGVEVDLVEVRGTRVKVASLAIAHKRNGDREDVVLNSSLQTDCSVYCGKPWVSRDVLTVANQLSDEFQIN